MHASRRTEVRGRTGFATELIELSEIDRARIEIDRALALEPNAKDAIALRGKVLTTSLLLCLTSDFSDS